LNRLFCAFTRLHLSAVRLHGAPYPSAMRSLLLPALFLGLALAASSCTPETNAPEAPPAATAPDTVTATPGARAPIRSGVMMVEGMEEPVTLHLYDAGPGFPLRFSTYVPEGWRAETVSSGEGDAVRFTPEGGDAAGVALTFFVYREQIRTGEARQMARNMADVVGNASREQRPERWALDAYSFDGPDLVGRLVLGRQAGRFFHFMSVYPPEWGDGFAPRAGIIIDEWVWHDTGRGLGR
jgi:hypothetical protein